MALADFLDSKTYAICYIAEQEEMAAGTHPQVKERIVKWFRSYNAPEPNITFLDWTPAGKRVAVSIDNELFGIFDYEKNEFINTPDKILQDKIMRVKKGGK